MTPVRLVELAIDEKVDFVLIADNLYDRDWLDCVATKNIEGHLVWPPGVL